MHTIIAFLRLITSLVNWNWRSINTMKQKCERLRPHTHTHNMVNNNRFIFDILSHIATHPIYPTQFAKSTGYNPFSLAPMFSLLDMYWVIEWPKAIYDTIFKHNVHKAVICFFWWIDFNFPLRCERREREGERVWRNWFCRFTSTICFIIRKTTVKSINK